MSRSSKRIFVIDPLGGLTRVRTDDSAESPSAERKPGRSGVYPSTPRPESDETCDGAFEDERPTRKLPMLKAV